MPEKIFSDLVKFIGQQSALISNQSIQIEDKSQKKADLTNPGVSLDSYMNTIQKSGAVSDSKSQRHSMMDNYSRVNL